MTKTYKCKECGHVFETSRCSCGAGIQCPKCLVRKKVIRV